MPLRSPSLAAATYTLLVVSALSLAASGCGATTGGRTNQPLTVAEGPLKPVNVGEDEFAQSLLRILADGTRSPQRDALLAGVVRRQLTHAAKRFSMGQAERGTDSVLGALYLVRVGEGNAAMIDATGASALDSAIRHLSLRGDEGRVHALMQMRTETRGEKDPGRAELDEHRANLERWLEDTHSGTTGGKLGAEARYFVARAMLDSSEKSMSRAADAIDAWVARGVEIERVFRQTGKRPVLAEAMEVERSSSMGPLMMAALYLRHGDAAGALARIEGSSVRLRTPPVLRRSLIGAAEDGDVRAWEMLAAIFAHEAAPTEADDEDRGERIDPRLIEAGLWGSLLEAYRKEPAAFSSLLAEQLVKLGLSEGAPAVLAQGLGDKPGPHDVASASRIVFEAMAVDADTLDNDAVHRTFRAALPLLSIADKPEYLAVGLEPSPSRLRLLMASVELRTGDLASARPLYLAAAKANPSVSGWMRVARTDRQAGDMKAAKASLQFAKTAPDARLSLLDLVEASLLGFEIERDTGNAAGAQAELGEALSLALAARTQKGNAAQRARAETLLGRVFSGYGETKGTRRAHERALTLAAQDRELFGATLLTVVARALVRRDLEAARAALHQGLDADLGQEERIYAGLWVFLLEKLERATPDGHAERALSPFGDRDAWVAKLALWANGKMTDETLAGVAQTASQKVEAEFYMSMLRKASGDASADKRLRTVADSPVLDLVEIELARDILAPPFNAPLPAGVSVP